MTILMVLKAPFPHDSRVEREATALTQAGLGPVVLLCEQTPDGSRPEHDMYQNFELYRVAPKPSKSLNPLLKSLFWSLLRVDLHWLLLLKQVVAERQPAVVHVHDLRLVPTAYWLKVFFRQRYQLVADLHEHYPALMGLLKARRPDGSMDTHKQQQVQRRWERLERWILPKCQAVITVVDEAKTRIGQRAWVVPNTIDLGKFPSKAELLSPQDTARQLKLPPERPFVITYVGYINAPHRGIHTMIEALAWLKQQHPHAYQQCYFIAAGESRPVYQAALDQLIQQHQLAEAVRFTGRLEEAGFVPYIQAAQVCLCPHEANPHTHHTFPNKLYMYHAYQKPVLSSDCKPLVRYLAETQGGWTFASGGRSRSGETAENLGKALLWAIDNSEMLSEYAKAGYHSVHTTHNWAATARAFVSQYQTLL